MWDNPSLLRGSANALFVLSLVLVLYGAARYVLHLPAFPVNAVELVAAPERVSVVQLQQVVREKVSGNFFTVDLDLTRQAFEKLPWVRKVSVRRKFPWTLQIDVEEHVALARWNGSALVNTHGEVFSATTPEILPNFIAQQDTSKQVTQVYSELNDVLHPIQQKILQISLSPRFAWQVKLENGMVLELGHEELQLRLARFVKVYTYSLANSAQAVRRVDLRYRNGFTAYMPGSEV
jgi:cell division protein FtsQ